MAFDFSGWATRNDLKCSDGRTIRKDAFKDNDGQEVPLVWQHIHDDPTNVLGHCLLENTDDGVYAYGKFNDTEAAQHAKTLVQNGDITALSIYANKLTQRGGDVLHGAIREVSLVLTGANPGAFIDVPVLAHSGEEVEDEAIIYTGEELVLMHSDEEEEAYVEHADDEDDGETVQDVMDSLTEKQRAVVMALIAQALQTEPTAEHSDEDGEHFEHADDEDETVEDVYNTLTDKQKKVVHMLIGQALDENGEDFDDEEEGDYDDSDNVEHSEGGTFDMKYNTFERTDANTELMHADFSEIMKEAKKSGSFREALENYSLSHGADDNLTDLGYTRTVDQQTGAVTLNPDYGIGNIDYLFPDSRTLNGTPVFVQRDMSWVEKVMNGVHRSPFSRIKSVFANITEDDARAKGYTKGRRKKEEIFGLLKRTTAPTTVYKKQKMDRDDVIDITDFDVIAWLKAEMRMMLDEEIARAILVGDQRPMSSDDKISEISIRPIYTDDDFFTIKASVVVADKTDEDDVAKKAIRTAIKARKNYKGSGTPTFFTSEDMLTSMLLLEDAIGHKLYKTEAELATALRVKEIVTVPVFEGLTRTDSNSVTRDLGGIIVNLADYNVGADKGGAVNMFDDFDLDYNQMLYLIETRCSGALAVPYSAIVLEIEESAAGDGSN